MISFRPYQVEMIDNVMAAFNADIPRSQIYAPTGAGKTNVFIEVVRLVVRRMLTEEPTLRILFVHPRIALSADQQERVMDEHGIRGAECHVFHSGGTIQDELMLSPTVADLYGVDIMRDNVDLCKARLGGGNIVMGNTLDPLTRLEEQTDVEAKLMRDWFSDQASLEDFFG